MMRARDLLAGLGVALGLLGLLAAIAPSTAGTLDLRIVPVQFVGIGAALLAISGYLARRRRVRSRASPPAVEQPVEWPRPGTDFDDALYRATTIGSVGRSERPNLRERLWKTAIAVVRATAGCDEETAKARLRDGTWTEDSRAISMFADEPPETPLGDVVRGLVTGRSQFHVTVTHVVDALRRNLEEES